MSESSRVVKFAPSIKFIVAVYAIEIVIAGLAAVYLLSRGAP